MVGVCRVFTVDAPNKTPVAGVAWTTLAPPVILPKAVKATTATILKSFMFSSLGQRPWSHSKLSLKAPVSKANSFRVTLATLPR
jgi:hypothetical protein